MEIYRRFLLFGLALTFALTGDFAHAFPQTNRPNQIGGVVFPLEVTKAGQTSPCTASLIRIKNYCGIFTAKHCLSDGFDAITLTTVSRVEADRAWTENREFKHWWPWFGTEQEYGFKSYPVRLKRVSGPSDLVELDIGAKKVADLCNKATLAGQLPPKPGFVVPKGIRESSVAAIGFVQGRPRINYTSGGSWTSDLGINGFIDLYRLSLAPNQVLFQCHDLEIEPGMSGGISFLNNPYPILGINSRAIPMQSKGLVLPTFAISNLLLEPEAVDQRQASLDVAFGRQGQITVSGNSQTDPSGNSQTDPKGGDKVPLHSLNVPLLRTKPLMVIREPSEGIVDPKDPSRVLLAAGGEQIDGLDDYFNLYEPLVKEGGGTAVVRPVNDELPISIRKGILERLSGVFQMTAVPLSREARFVEDSQEFYGWRRTDYGLLADAVIIDPKKAEIMLVWDDSFSLDASTTRLSMMTKSQLKFSVQISADAQKLTLTPQAWVPKDYATPETLTCDNHHYLKIICSSEHSTFSLSLSGFSSGRLSYRWAVEQIRSGKRHIIYRFGTVVVAGPVEGAQ